MQAVFSAIEKVANFLFFCNIFNLTGKLLNLRSKFFWIKTYTNDKAIY